MPTYVWKCEGTPPPPSPPPPPRAKPYLYMYNVKYTELKDFENAPPT